MINPRRKGKAGEREAAQILRGFLGTAVTWNLGQTRDGGPTTSSGCRAGPSR